MSMPDRVAKMAGTTFGNSRIQGTNGTPKSLVPTEFPGKKLTGEILQNSINRSNVTFIKTVGTVRFPGLKDKVWKNLKKTLIYRR